MLEAKRTLVKSRPELWSELADPGTLARHLGPFGSVRIVRARPQTLVEWEGERAQGTVRLEPSGFGTHVVLTAGVPDPPPSSAEPDPPLPRPRRWTRLLRLSEHGPEAVAALPAPASASSPPSPPSTALTDEAALRVLTECLDTLGRAHHRPFSRL